MTANFARKIGAPTLILAFALSTVACSNNPKHPDNAPVSDGESPTSSSSTSLKSYGRTQFDNVIARSSEAITWAYEEPEEPIHCVFPEGGRVDTLNGPLVLTGGTVALVTSGLSCLALLGPNAFICKPFAMAVGGIFGLGLTNKGLKALTCPVPTTVTDENNGLKAVQP